MDREALEHVLTVARIKLPEGEKERMLEEIRKILRLAELLEGEEAEPSEELTGWRKDVPHPDGTDYTVVFPRKKDRLLEVPPNL